MKFERRTLVASSGAHVRLKRAAEWLGARGTSERVLVIGASLDAASELLREVASRVPAAFGWERLTCGTAGRPLRRPGLARTRTLPIEPARSLPSRASKNTCSPRKSCRWPRRTTAWPSSRRPAKAANAWRSRGSCNARARNGVPFDKRDTGPLRAGYGTAGSSGARVSRAARLCRGWALRRPRHSLAGIAGSELFWFLAEPRYSTGT
jgi:hypothetical protein